MLRDLFINFATLFLQTSEIGVTEHIEGDECKFALWTGTVAPVSDYKVILRVSDRNASCHEFHETCHSVTFCFMKKRLQTML